MDQKKYILDTSTLIHDPSCIMSFQEHDVVIPYVVVDEIDGLRKSPNGRGMSAREVIRQLEELRIQTPSLDRAPLGDGLGKLYVRGGDPILKEISPSRRDDMVLACAADMTKKYGQQAVLVAKDVGLRIRASIMGIKVEDYRKSKVENGFSGLHEEPIRLDIGSANLHAKEVPAPDGLLENEFCYFEAGGYESCGHILCRVKKGVLCPVSHFTKGVLGIRPLDDYQRMAFDVLLDDDIICVSLTGVAGSGKTLLTLAVGLDMLNNGEYESIMSIKPIIPVGRDIGYLKGDKVDKLYEWQKPIVDNMRIIQMYAGKGEDSFDPMEMIDDGRWHPEAMTYMRGRHLHGYWVILDECQNLTGHEIKTALSRVGQKTKVVILADPTQIDSPYVDASSCGSAITTEKLKGSPLFAAVPMLRSQRSEFAQLVSDMME